MMSTADDDRERERLGQRGPISDGELERFKEIDLPLLNNGAYFRSVFGAAE